MEDFSVYNGEGTELRKAQMRMVDILMEIDKVCRRHDIPYWLDFGTLLGAVRHGGFIPWDDDLDITIFKKDNRRLMSYLEKELPQQYYVFHERTKTGYFRVVDRKSMVLRPGQDESAFDLEGNGLWVDIFNVEPATKAFKTKMNGIHGKAFRRIKRQINDGAAKRLASYLVYPFTSLTIALYRLFHLGGCKGRYIYNIPNFVVPQMFSQRHISQILPTSDIEFEGRMFKCPHDTDAFLKETYKDYMTVPPKEKRQVHTVFVKVLE